jgi:hypothetical protein
MAEIFTRRVSRNTRKSKTEMETESIIGGWWGRDHELPTMN